MNRDRGSASLWAMAVGLVLVLFAAALAGVGSAIGARHRARTAADLAALAGAARALEGVSVACGRAHEYAVANGAALDACRLDGFDLVVAVSVTTRFGPATAAARAGPVAVPRRPTSGQLRRPTSGQLRRPTSGQLRRPTSGQDQG